MGWGDKQVYLKNLCTAFDTSPIRFLELECHPRNVVLGALLQLQCGDWAELHISMLNKGGDWLWKMSA